MKALIIVLLIVGAGFSGWKIYEQWEVARDRERSADARTTTQLSGSALPGLDPSLEGSLENAKRGGAQGLKNFLTRYGKTIKDPRLGSIELDYAVLVVKHDPVEAKKVFARVKQRTSPSSPLYARVKQLEKAYE